MKTKLNVLMAFALLVGSTFATVVSAQKFDEKFEHWPVDLKINGRIIVNNGLEDFSTVQQLFERIVKDKQVVSFDFNGGNDESKMVLALKEAAGDTGDVKVAELSELKTAMVEAASLC